jgi:hypothetical protein
VTSAPPPASVDVGTTADALRVVPFPFDDPYVHAVLPDGVLRVGSLIGTGAPAGTGPWLDPRHLADHAAEVDVLHLHVGLGDGAADGLEGWSETVRRLGVPLVVTVHDLGGEQDDGLAAVLGTAEVVLTLTPGAADEIAERFGRTAIVVAHPTVAEPDPELGAERGLVGVRLDASAGIGGNQIGLVRAALSGAVSGGGRLRLLVAVDVVPTLEPAVRALATSGEVELVPYVTKDWAAALQQLHVAVLPERCGSHSRDLEICRDVGTRVVAPHCGWFADQWSDVVAYAHDEQGNVDAVSLSAAVSAALTRPIPRAADRGWRFEQREAVRRVHAEVYAQVAADRRWS